MAPYKFTKLIHDGEQIEMYGDGTSERDYTYITDIVDGVISAMEKNYGFEISDVSSYILNI